MCQTSRAQALKWWRAMELEDQRGIVNKYHKGIDFRYIATSSMRIEAMWTKEQV
jgi:hypothetical protein